MKSGHQCASLSYAQEIDSTHLMTPRHQGLSVYNSFCRNGKKKKRTKIIWMIQPPKNVCYFYLLSASASLHSQAQLSLNVWAKRKKIGRARPSAAGVAAQLVTRKQLDSPEHGRSWRCWCNRPRCRCRREAERSGRRFHIRLEKQREKDRSVTIRWWTQQSSRRWCHNKKCIL